MNLFIDTEFTCLPWCERSQLISIGVYFEDGVEYYACSSEFDLSSVSEFVLNCVVPLLPEKEHRKTEAAIGAELEEVISTKSITNVWAVFPTLDQLKTMYRGTLSMQELHSKYADWDFQLMNRLMHSLPANYPQNCNDLSPLIQALGKSRLPENKLAHNALEDAKWNYKVWQVSKNA